MTCFYHISAVLPSLRHPDASCKSSRRFARVVPKTRPCCPEALTEAPRLLNFPILRIGYLYDKRFHGINKQFSEGLLSVFLLQGVATWQSPVFRKCLILNHHQTTTSTGIRLQRRLLYLILNHHQTTTISPFSQTIITLYLILNHHQTTTLPEHGLFLLQLYLILNHHQTTTLFCHVVIQVLLYLILNHHQTTTR